MQHEGERGAALDDNERLAWLRLIRSENVGPVTFRKLIARFGSAQAALDAIPDLSRQGGQARTLRICSTDDAQRELDLAERLGCRLICMRDPEFPDALASAEGAPPVIALRGSVSSLQKPCVSIVGSRNASAIGAKITRVLADGIGKAGYSIASGLARGIDAAAHDASLQSGTIAVLAGGLDRPYPPQNIALLEDICASGTSAAISEMPFGWEPRARDFPRRNRIIAGLGLGLIVVEAAKKSGSLISARIAGELGRLVFAVPGSPLDPRAKGTNDLIKDGAILTTEPQDVITALRPLGGKGPPRVAQPALWEDEPDSHTAIELSASQRTNISDAMGPAPVSIDDLARHTDVPQAQIYLALLELDLAGRLARHPGGLVSLTPEPGH
ncbi:DNA-processing protein DprA [Hoeflea prorocentri]|uniref:DNA-processing protein DprA n=1 Tax=Hoeflea prorocentri TaxID=1922333 RepID=A0A9X3ZG78_9HYPH|nr:DNA-processing protein DprA [Hoeflea prorocentri]MCY6380487.1 DNA-processing protein DprA [Hoeflea prorocentri]MDA5398287.1 DNA-processing protein DprA [Hoeflea prorocentri]